jgi:hypothetical protein
MNDIFHFGALRTLLTFCSLLQIFWDFRKEGQLRSFMVVRQVSYSKDGVIFVLHATLQLM